VKQKGRRVRGRGRGGGRGRNLFSSYFTCVDRGEGELESVRKGQRRGGKLALDKPCCAGRRQGRDRVLVVGSADRALSEGQGRPPEIAQSSVNQLIHRNGEVFSGRRRLVRVLTQEAAPGKGRGPFAPRHPSTPALKPSPPSVLPPSRSSNSRTQIHLSDSDTAQVATPAPSSSPPPPPRSLASSPTPPSSSSTGTLTLMLGNLGRRSCRR